MKVIFTIAGLQPEHGGPSYSVPALAEALARAGTAVEILTQQYGPTWQPPLAPAADLVTTTFVDASSPLARRLQWSPQFKKVLQARAQRSGAQIIHDAGLWLRTNHAAAQVARAARLPLIISPRGMLTAWSLQFKGWKKRLAWQLYQQRDVRSAQVLHATSAAEAEGFRALGLRQPIAVIPNGVALPREGQKAECRMQNEELRMEGAEGGRQKAECRMKNEELRMEGAEGRRQKAEGEDGKTEIEKLKTETEGRNFNFQLSTFNSQPNVRTVLFLSRIHPKKGLLDLVRAWAAIQNSKFKIQNSESGGRPRWRVVVAGGDEGGHLQELKAEIGKLNLGDVFEFIGPVEGAAKWELYRQADLFVLPSHSENFGIVVAEALACGVPVIASRGTPWEDLVTHRCGWWPAIGSEPLAAALREALSRTDEERRAMGARGRELVQAKYGWPGAAEQMQAVYQWMLKQAAKPDWVLIS